MAKGKHHINPDTGEIGVCSATIRCDFATDGEVPIHYETRKEAQAALDETFKDFVVPEPLKKQESIIGLIDDPDNDGPDPSPGFDEADWDAWRDAIPDTPDMGCAWENYIDIGHTTMNGILRRDEAFDALEAEGLWDQQLTLVDVENLKNMFNSPIAPTVKHTSVVFRGVEAEKYKHLKYGDEFVDEGFISTSQSDDVGEFGDFVLRVVVPKGKRFIPGNEGDNELIFAPGTKFRVGNRFLDELQVEMVLDEHDEVDFQ